MNFRVPSHVGWVRRSRNPTWSRQLRPLLDDDAARLTQPTQRNAALYSLDQALVRVHRHFLPANRTSIGVSL